MTTQVILHSSDEQEFKVSRDVAKMSETINHMIEDIGGDHPIPLPNVTGKILAKVIDYCNYHVANPAVSVGDDSSKNSKEDKKVDVICEWDQRFCEVDQATLFELILAANYLDIKVLLDVTCKTVANMIKSKTPEEIRKLFNIKNDFTPEEEEQVRKENEWCEER